MRITRFFPIILLLTARTFADGPADNLAEKVRRVPPPGLPVPDSIREDLTERAARLGTAIDALRPLAEKRHIPLNRLADIQIFQKAVDWALRYDEFYRTNEFDVARNLLRIGLERAAALRNEQTPWLETNGPVVCGYVSRIDGSIQPYGLVVPKAWSPGSGQKWRLDFWFHGRGEQLSELAFLNDRMRSYGEFAPADAFVLHLYGRYCNGNRFAGEVDLWEALEDVKSNYRIDEDRLVVRGFSLGGAACWHFATHYAGKWVAAAPGAGFSETAEFLRVFQNEELKPANWEQKLWRLYDSTSQALNVSMVPLVAYSGEDDKQIQAAQAMERAMRSEGLRLTHIIGPKTGHRYETNAKVEISRRIDAIASHPRERVPQTVRFVTHTLRYNEMNWVTVDALDQHWEPARVEASLQSTSNRIVVQTTNVSALTLTLAPGDSPFNPLKPVVVEINGQSIEAGKPASDRSWMASFHRDSAGWKFGSAPGRGLRKVHGLQGPIDDAFMESFLMVLPGNSSSGGETPANWVNTESQHAIDHWRRQFRGDARQKVDRDVTDADIAGNNLVLWGDPASNAVLARIADRLPIRWTRDSITVGDKSYPADRHVPVLIYPNPLNPDKYVVLNSGFTFREYDYLNNARQTPKLPDWAVLDISQPATSRGPGRIADAGFFDERWELIRY